MRTREVAAWEARGKEGEVVGGRSGCPLTTLSSVSSSGKWGQCQYLRYGSGLLNGGNNGLIQREPGPTGPRSL